METLISDRFWLYVHCFLIKTSLKNFDSRSRVLRHLCHGRFSPREEISPRSHLKSFNSIPNGDSPSTESLTPKGKCLHNKISHVEDFHPIFLLQMREISSLRLLESQLLSKCLTARLFILKIHFVACNLISAQTPVDNEK